MNRACALPPHIRASSKTEGFNQSSTTRSITRASTDAYTFKVATVVFCEPFRTDQSTDLARLAVNDTTTPDNTTVLHKSIKSRPSPRPCCATPPSLAVVDEVDANRSALEPLQPASSQLMGFLELLRCSATVHCDQSVHDMCST
jgi:hypothetical protein